MNSFFKAKINSELKFILKFILKFSGIQFACAQNYIWKVIFFNFANLMASTIALKLAFPLSAEVSPKFGFLVNSLVINKFTISDLKFASDTVFILFNSNGIPNLSIADSKIKGSPKTR